MGWDTLPLLAEHFLERVGAEVGRRMGGISAAAMKRLLVHAWPGNVRELRNVIERGVVVAGGPLLDADELGLDAAEPAAPVPLDEIERQPIAHTLRRTAGNVSQAARLLGIDRVTLYGKLRKFGIPRAGA